MPHPRQRRSRAANRPDRVPGFVRGPIDYNILPRHPSSAFPDGTIQDRIGWVVLHPDLRSLVDNRLRPYPTTALWVSVYRATAEAAVVYPHVGQLAHQGELNNWDTTDNSKAYFAAQRGHYSVLYIADIAINQIASPDNIRLLRDLLPSRHQHIPYRHPYSSATRTTVPFHIPTPQDTNRTSGNAWGSPDATGGWGTSPPEWKFDPWATSKPDTDTTTSSGEEATTATTISRATGSTSPPPLSPVIPPSASQRAASPGNQSVAGSSLLAYLDDELHLPQRRTQPLDQGNKAVTWVDRALGAMALASRGAQP